MKVIRRRADGTWFVIGNPHGGSDVSNNNTANANAL